MSDTPVPKRAAGDDDDATDEVLGASSGRPTGEDQAADNRENEPPA